MVAGIRFSAVIWIILALIVAVWHYSSERREVAEAYATLNGKLKQQQEQAAELLKDMTSERDAKQLLLDQAAADQEKKDAQAQEDIARLDRELRERPIRVRYVSPPSGGGGCGPEGEDAAAASAGAGGSSTAYGLLPEQNSRRLAIALNEVETLSAAYNSCRNTLLREITGTSALGGK